MSSAELHPVHTLDELESLGQQNPRYAELAKSAARNLGGSNIHTLSDAMSWLSLNVLETGGIGGGESGVVREVNFLL